MSPEIQKAIDALRSEGYAVTIFNPEELDGSDPGQVEDIMVARGWDAIATLSVKNHSQE